LKTKKKIHVPKPESMADVPDSHSDDDGSSGDDAYKGLENAAIFLGEGPVLYLQILKTILWMFFFLCLVNLPAFLVLPGLSDHNEWSDLEAMGRYLSLGNIGYLTQRCVHSHLSLGAGTATYQRYIEASDTSSEPDYPLNNGLLPSYVIGSLDTPTEMELTCPGSDQ
jgi:hypothetical protein